MRVQPNPVTVTSPLGPGALRFLRMSGGERLGGLYEYELDVAGTDPGLDLGQLVGQCVAVNLELAEGTLRHFHGLVRRLVHVASNDQRAHFRATLVPALWRLTKRSGCRIFQDKTVPEIVRAIFDEHGLGFDDRLVGSYPRHDYQVQYRESDFHFVSRLMEREGIYYYFAHEAEKHTLVLADASGAHQPVVGYEEVPFFPPQEGSRRERDHLHAWSFAQQIVSCAASLRDYDFKRPKANLEVRRASGQNGAGLELEVYDFPGCYHESSEGERYARTRLEEHAVQLEQLAGEGNARGLSAGTLFRLAEHPRPEQNREYLITSHYVDLAAPEDERSSGGDGLVFSCSVRAIDGRVAFRAGKGTPKPIVQGPHTARVVGKAGEEIWTDEYGRVKVQFHWDRTETSENSSCWLRVAHPWAGSKFGSLFLPRIGQEVVVEFLEGDPDRPLITGQLYDADHMPPYALPANQTRSGFKTRSTKGGGADNANELRFEDKKGEEQLFVQAERNYDRVVKKDATYQIGNDETWTVGHDRKTSVTNDETVAVGANRTESVGKDEKIAIAENRTETVGKDESVTITGGRTLNVGGDETIQITGGRTESVGKDAALTVSGSRAETVEKSLALSVTENRSQSIGGKDVLEVGKSLTIEAADEIVLKSGDAQVTLKKNGDIVIKGKNVTIEGSGKINAKASGDLVLKGSKVTAN